MPDSGDQPGGEPVGSLAEEAARLVAAMMTGGGAGQAPSARVDGDESGPHTCPHGWCPLCQVVEYVQDHPEIVTQVVVAGAEFLTVVRDAVEKITGPREDPT